ncbi:MAG TPA: transposase [Methanoregulaceae archaeon]|nr:transposase [Methanoregulaceae archaeon]
MKGEIKLELAIKKVNRGSQVYTDRFQSYNGLVSYGLRHKRSDHGKRCAKVMGSIQLRSILLQRTRIRI